MLASLLAVGNAARISAVGLAFGACIVLSGCIPPQQPGKPETGGASVAESSPADRAASAQPGEASSAPAEAAGGSVVSSDAVDVIAQNAHYILVASQGALEDGYTVEYDDAMTDYGSSGRAGHITYVYTPSSGSEPYLTVIQCTADWFGLQGDEGQSTSAVAFTSEDADGTELQTIVRGGLWGTYGPMTREESLAFTQQWAQRVRPVDE